MLLSLVKYFYFSMAAIFVYAYICIYICVALISMVYSKNREFKEFLIRPMLHFAAGHALSSSAQNAVSWTEAPLSETIGFIQEEKKNDPLSGIP